MTDALWRGSQCSETIKYDQTSDEGGAVIFLGLEQCARENRNAEAGDGEKFAGKKKKKQCKANPPTEN